MNFPGLPLAILALTGALASTVHFNHKFHDLIESKLHNLGATEYGPGSSTPPFLPDSHI